MNAKDSARCTKCIYSGRTGGGGTGSATTCDYILVTGHRRPCEIGTACTVFTARKHPGRPRRDSGI